MVYSSIRTFIIISIFSSFNIILTPQARSASIHDFNVNVTEAYVFYREAFFLLRTGNPQVASIELEEMENRWEKVIERFGTMPPEIYSKDPKWEKTLLVIKKNINQGLAKAIKGESKAAIKTLRPIRTMLSDLRRRNGVFVYSDTVDEANSAFSRLKKFRYTPPDFNVVEEVDQLRQSLALTVYWYKKCVENAPQKLHQNPEFKRLMDDSLFSLSRIWVAIANKKTPNLISLIRGLSSSDQMLFLRFG
jgi:hypothetical protein